jgi:hypothetical protein
VAGYCVPHGWRCHAAAALRLLLRLRPAEACAMVSEGDARPEGVERVQEVPRFHATATLDLGPSPAVAGIGVEG